MISAPTQPAEPLSRKDSTSFNQRILTKQPRSDFWVMILLIRLRLYASLGFLRFLGLFIPIEARAYAGRSAFWLEKWLFHLGQWRAYAIYQKAVRRCPAYVQFLKDERSMGIALPKDWTSIPAMTKENYVKRYDIESRCYDGEIPPTGVTIDESAGSTGIPNNWVRGKEERAHSAYLMRLNQKLIYANASQKTIMLNCFAMGPWGTGITVTNALADTRILKSLGPDASKLENALRVFGPTYTYVILGYPPFVKHFLDTTTLDLTPYELHAVVGGEGMSEGLRDYLLRYFKNVRSAFGASDLEISMAGETELSIALRRWMRQHPEACQAFFGRPQPPMIFQYNPAHYFIETQPNGELLFTITRLSTIAPKIRYNLRDVGGTMRHNEFQKRLEAIGLSPKHFSKCPSPYPLLWLYGRSDQSVAFYGAKIFVGDFQNILNEDPIFSKNFQSFQFKTREDDHLRTVLSVYLERLPSSTEIFHQGALQERLFKELMRVNQDFREISSVISKDQLDLHLYPASQGPFAANALRIKNKYVG